VLPDGRHYLFLVALGAWEKNAIYLGSLDGREKKRLVDSPNGFSYAPPAQHGRLGHLLFLRADTLMAQPFDPRSYELAGAVFPLAEGVGSVLRFALFTASENGTLAYRIRRAAVNRS
jgi:hypothetical protein